MKYLFVLAGLLLVAGCPGAAETSDAGAPGDGAAAVVSGCLDQPTALPRPPGATLPCELIAPNLNLSSQAK